MSPMQTIVLLGCLLLVQSTLWASSRDEVLRTAVAKYAPAAQLLTNNCIRVDLTGKLDVEMSAIVHLLSRDNLLEEIQREYAVILPAGEKPEFEIKLAASNHYYYVNAKEQRSDIVEVSRQEVEQGRMRGAYYTSGRRFFGQFEAITIIDIHQNEQNDVIYDVHVLAYPHVAISRFFARHLGLIERYFVSKSQELESLTVAICRNMVE